MKKITFTFVFLMTFIYVGFSQDSVINPTPQQMHLSEERVFASHFRIKYKNVSAPTVALLEKILQNRSGKIHKMNVLVGTKGQSVVKKYASKIPQKKEGYYLLIEAHNIVVAGYDERGTYYGVRTLEQLLQGASLPMGEIVDYPDVPNRGVVEGFYGQPWSHEKRLRQLDFYGRNKLNTYIYGPKDDPYHSSPNWRIAYPDNEATQIKELIDASEANFVDFVWAIHPGKDIQWNEKDRNNLLQKFEQMYQLGVRAFAVFFDDISGEGTNPNKQADLLNFINEHFVAVKKDVKPLIMCPTEYNKSWSNPEKRYLETLGEKLHPSIEIMWTGNRVVADIDEPTLAWINPKIKRKAYIWWNFPVSDYVRDHMLLGAAYGNANNIKDQMSGFVSNPMEHPEASKIAIYGVADYTWNLLKYNPERAWKNAIHSVLPLHSEALLVFASHNSDLGPNGHQYRREESVYFKPIADDFIQNLNKKNHKNVISVKNEFNKIINASEELLNNKKDNPFLIEELEPWLIQFRTQGELGQQVMVMYDALFQNDTKMFEQAYNETLQLQKQMFDIDQKYNQNPYQPGVKTGTLVIEPLINNTLAYLVGQYNQTYGKTLKLSLNYNPNRLYTNILQLEHQPILQKGKKLRISPVLEYATVKKGDYIGLELEVLSSIQSIGVNLGNTDSFTFGMIQISADGKIWKNAQGGNVRNGKWTQNETYENVKFVRFISTSDREMEIQLKQFEISIK